MKSIPVVIALCLATLLLAACGQQETKPNIVVIFIEFGMTPLEALQAGTIRSAEAYGLGDATGAIEPGLEADLLVFDRNPLLQPSALHNPLMVMSNGRLGLNRHVGNDKVIPGH